MKPATTVQDTSAADCADTELVRRLTTFLVSKHGELRNVSVTAEQGTVWLAGTVNSFYAKQLAIDLAIHTSGVKNVVDQLKVGPSLELPREGGAARYFAPGS